MQTVTTFQLGVMEMFYGYHGDECTTMKILKVLPDAKYNIQDG